MMYLYAIALWYFKHYTNKIELIWISPNLFQHNSGPVHNAPSTYYTWFAKVGVEKLEWPAQSFDFNNTEHLWNIDCTSGRPCSTTSYLTNALGRITTQIPSYSTGIIIRAKEEHNIWNRMYKVHMAMCPKTFGHIVYL